MTDLTGHVYGLLTVLSLHGTKHHPGGGSRRMWLCRCECGQETKVAGNNLRNGHTTSCGAWYHRKTFHGQSNSQLYHAWENMIARCTKPNHPNYADYGGRGIKVCPRWMDFRLFYEDMADGWRDGLVIDRYPDNNGNYEKSNCRWTTQAKNNLNKRNTVLWDYEGARVTAKELSEISPIPVRNIYERLGCH